MVDQREDHSMGVYVLLSLNKIGFGGRYFLQKFGYDERFVLQKIGFVVAFSLCKLETSSGPHLSTWQGVLVLGCTSTIDSNHLLAAFQDN